MIYYLQRQIIVIFSVVGPFKTHCSIGEEFLFALHKEILL